ncbi:MAG: hypothetical protein L0Y64_25120 [Myxococcaceae bacterium]|nr:hypothetical protein [Myxococcaceae bacterium]
MSDRVDKGWAEKGLGSYSTEAILATLQHYGIQADETTFRAMAEDAYPLRIAFRWMEAWKGTGQFARLPGSAAEVLWRRWLPDRPTPGEFLEALSGVLVLLGRLLGGKAAAAEVDEALENVEAVCARVPEQDGVRDGRFFEEAFSFLPRQQMEAFDALGEALAKAGHAEAAKRFTRLEETVLPERVGIATAVVRAALGERAAAVDYLKEVTSPRQPSPRHVFAVDALIHLNELTPAREGAEALLDEAEKAEDWHLAMDACARLDHIYTQQGDRAARQALGERAAHIEAAHAKAHPEHLHPHKH